MSPAVQGWPVPVRYTLIPVAAVSVRPSVPHGVVAPSAGPGESTSGNVGLWLNRIAGDRSTEVVEAGASTARYASEAYDASTTTSAIPIRLPTAATSS